MNIRILTIFMAVILSFPLFCQSGELSPKSELPESPRITFTETEYDFGIIRPGADAAHFFIFSNTGKVPLIILNVRTSCGCMVPAWPKVPVGPGVKDSIRVGYNTKVKGTFNKIITIQSNAENGLIELRIKGNVARTK